MTPQERETYIADLFQIHGETPTFCKKCGHSDAIHVLEMPIQVSKEQLREAMFNPKSVPCRRKGCNCGDFRE